MNFTEFANKSGEKISVCFREFQPSDVQAIIDLIREEYICYLKPQYLNPETLIDLHRRSEVVFYVVQTQEGKIVACLNDQKNSQNKFSDMGTGIIAKDYRQFRLFEPLIKFVMDEIYKKNQASAICAHLVMYHQITEKLIDRLGLKPCAFELQVMAVDKWQPAYQNRKTAKHSLVFTTKKVTQNDVGKVYLPQEHLDFAENIYNSLDVDFKIVSEKNPLQGKTEIEVGDVLDHKYTAILVKNAGVDLAEKILEVEKSRQDPLQNFNLFVNTSQPQAVTAYEVLRELGYFFTGVEPLGGNRELMVMNNPKKLKIYFEEMQATAHYLPLRNYVQKCYESR